MARRRKRVIVGLDVHKRETQIAVVPENGKGLVEMRIRTTPRAFARALEGVDGPVILESVGFHRPIVRWLRAMDREVHLANTRLIPKPKVKTDKKDAKHLAKLFKGDLLPESWIPPEEIQRLRDLVRHRHFLGHQSGRLKSKIKHDLLKHGHFVEGNPAETKSGRARVRKLNIPEVTSCIRVLEAVELEINDLQRQIESEARAREDVMRLTSIPGIAEYTALGIYAEAGDFARFPDAEKLASYAGLSITEHQSGDREHKFGITKAGNLTLLTLLVEAVHNHARVCPESALARKFTRWHQEKGAKKAAIATSRALIHVIYAMIRDKTTFNVNGANSNARHAA